MLSISSFSFLFLSPSSSMEDIPLVERNCASKEENVLLNAAVDGEWSATSPFSEEIELLEFHAKNNPMIERISRPAFPSVGVTSSIDPKWEFNNKIYEKCA